MILSFLKFLLNFNFRFKKCLHKTSLIYWLFRDL
nr:MAG TPA_asm: hypothetical protein [Caudoviricetes sp.]